MDPVTLFCPNLACPARGQSSPKLSLHQCGMKPTHRIECTDRVTGVGGEAS